MSLYFAVISVLVVKTKLCVDTSSLDLCLYADKPLHDHPVGNIPKVDLSLFLKNRIKINLRFYVSNCVSRCLKVLLHLIKSFIH